MREISTKTAWIIILIAVVVVTVIVYYVRIRPATQMKVDIEKEIALQEELIGRGAPQGMQETQ